MELRVALVAGAVGTLAGCAGAAAGSPPSQADTEAEPDPEAAKAAFLASNENFARLRALEVVDVRSLAQDMPGHTPSCYSSCKHERNAMIRLDKLVDVAEAAVKSPVPNACDDATIDKNVAALNALHIVQVGGLIKEVPKNNASCYNRPCEADLQAAKAVTCERAGKLASIVNATKDL
ncbi:hypothetical protein [Polyangium sp. 15x6]|uniref:hypothetical protein n=1 Tax=Polyangium sp. 15x6 TaxID=3042687 RepID=UPI00249CED94|nr:hypothetical protein [Polyangium sp. 15x6]MDI3291482.1 hypothetical protein [Polyangium sp. 15x6]